MWSSPPENVEIILLKNPSTHRFLHQRSDSLVLCEQFQDFINRKFGHGSIVSAGHGLCLEERIEYRFLDRIGCCAEEFINVSFGVYEIGEIRRVALSQASPIGC